MASRQKDDEWYSQFSTNTKDELTWLAGQIDTEGHIGIQRSTPSVGWTNTSLALTQHICSILKWPVPEPRLRHDYGHKLPIYQLQIGGWKAAQILESICRGLQIERKRLRSMEVLARYESYNRNFRSYPLELPILTADEVKARGSIYTAAVIDGDGCISTQSMSVSMKDEGAVRFVSQLWNRNITVRADNPNRQNLPSKFNGKQKAHSLKPYFYTVQTSDPEHLREYLKHGVIKRERAELLLEKRT